MDRYLALLNGLTNRDEIYMMIFAFAICTLISLAIMTLLSRWKKMPAWVQRLASALRSALYVYNLGAFILFFVLSAKGG